MKDYKKELDHYEYNKRFKSAREHSLDFLKDDKEVKKFESGEHDKRTYEVQEGVFKTAKELLTPTKNDIRQSNPEITGQADANPPSSEYEFEFEDLINPSSKPISSESGGVIQQIPDNVIRYTSSYNEVINPKGDFGANIISNENGVITFDGVVTRIPEYAFSSLEYLTSIEIPKQVKVIGKYAFKWTSIKTIDLPESVEEIQLNAFPSIIETIVCRRYPAPILNYFYSGQQETQTVGRDNYKTLGSAKIYAYNTQSFGKVINSCSYGDWRSYIKDAVKDEFINREIIDIHLL